MSILSVLMSLFSMHSVCQLSLFLRLCLSFCVFYPISLLYHYLVYLSRFSHYVCPCFLTLCWHCFIVYSCQFFLVISFIYFPRFRWTVQWSGWTRSLSLLCVPVLVASDVLLLEEASLSFWHLASAGGLPASESSRHAGFGIPGNGGDNGLCPPPGSTLRSCSGCILGFQLIARGNCWVRTSLAAASWAAGFPFEMPFPRASIFGSSSWFPLDVCQWSRTSTRCPTDRPEGHPRM